MVISSDRGTVTAELAIALPAILTLVVFLLSALGTQAVRVGLVAEAGTLARAAARGEQIRGTVSHSGMLTCVSVHKPMLIDLQETACARTLGL